MIDEELRVHIAAIDGWIGRHIEKGAEQVGLSKEEGKQLQAIEKSIKQLSNNGVDIPDDLRRLKLELSARDVPPSASSLSETQKKAVSELVHELRRLTDGARKIQKRVKKPGGANTGKRHYRVSLKDLVGGGYLSVEDKLQFSWQNGEMEIEGNVHADGTVSARTNNGWETFKSLSTAATSIAGSSLNGWIYWRKVNPDGSRTLLNDIRAQFLNERNGE